MSLYKIVHTDRFIHWVCGPNGPDKDGATNTILPSAACGNVMDRKDHYEIVGGQCVLKSTTDMDQIRLREKRKEKITRARITTRALLSEFTYSGNAKTYILTDSIISQFTEYRETLREAVAAGESVNDYFPMDIEMGFDEDNLPLIQPISDIDSFKSVYLEIKKHISLIKKEEAVIIKLLKTMDSGLLDSWIDQRS